MIVVCVLITILVAIWLIQYRNHAVFCVRKEFIEDDELFAKYYRKLPDYDEMAMRPKHWHRWTKKHWLNYVKDKQ